MEGDGWSLVFLRPLMIRNWIWLRISYNNPLEKYTLWFRRFSVMDIKEWEVLFEATLWGVGVRSRNLSPRSTSWGLCIPIKVSLFVWEVVWTMTLTLDWIKRREWAMGKNGYMSRKGGNNQSFTTSLYWSFNAMASALYPLWGMLGLILKSKVTLHRWNCSFVGNRHKIWKWPPFVFFGQFWE